MNEKLVLLLAAGALGWVILSPKKTATGGTGSTANGRSYGSAQGLGGASPRLWYGGNIGVRVGANPYANIPNDWSLSAYDAGGTDNAFGYPIY